MTGVRLSFTMGFVAAFVGCGGAARPVDVDVRHDACSLCRMTVSDPHLAAQIVGSGEDARLFDDIGCLSTFLKEHSQRPDQVVYVADHRSGAWIDARRAVFSRLPSASTPMASGLIAHESRASRDADASAAGSTMVAFDDVLQRPQVGASR